jgi:uncharacterized protein YggE
MSRLAVTLGAAALAVLLAAAGAAALLASPLFQTAPAVVGAQPAPAGGPPSITVTSEGSANAQPDQATVTVGVQAIKPTAAEALAEANRQTEAMLAKLDELGIPRQNVQTAGISLYPVQRTPEQPGGEAQIGGYRASNQVTVRLTDLARVGPVLDGVVAAGANQISGVRFGLQDDSALRGRAMQQAVQKARPQADAIAAGLGLKAGDILEVREEPTVGAPPAPQAAEGRGGVPVEPGQLTARVRVQVTFALTPTA